MPSARLPNETDLSKTKGPAVGNTGDHVGAEPPTDWMQAPEAKFEPVSPEGHQARFTRDHANTRKAVAPSGKANFTGQAASRGIKSMSPEGVTAHAGGPTILSGNHNPVRGSGRKTQAKDIAKLKTAGQ